MDRQLNRCMDRWTESQIDGGIDSWTNNWMDKQLDRWANRWIEGRKIRYSPFIQRFVCSSIHPCVSNRIKLLPIFDFVCQALQRWTDGYVYRWMYWWIDGLTVGQTNNWIDEHTTGQMDRKLDILLSFEGLSVHLPVCLYIMGLSLCQLFNLHISGWNNRWTDKQLNRWTERWTDVRIVSFHSKACE